MKEEEEEEPDSLVGRLSDLLTLAEASSGFDP
jgi:hypothetical protein